MTYSYQPNFVANGQANDMYSQKKSIALPVALGTGAIGGTVAAVIASKKHPYISKKGEATDTFTKNVYKKYAETTTSEEYKTTYNQHKRLLKEINSVKSAEELKTLINNNKEAMTSFNNGNVDDFMKNVTDENFKKNKATIKQHIETSRDTSLRDIKNKIMTYWNEEKKAFVNDIKNEKMVEAIKYSAKKYKLKSVAKCGIITTLITSIASFIACKLLDK
jgi:hypothetical protein